MAARYTLYRADMGSDHEAEIRASVGAHDDLGPGYDDAVAEGLVERIGAEIDKRVEAQLRRYGAPYGPYFAPPGSIRSGRTIQSSSPSIHEPVFAREVAQRGLRPRAEMLDHFAGGQRCPGPRPSA